MRCYKQYQLFLLMRLGIGLPSLPTQEADKKIASLAHQTIMSRWNSLRETPRL